MRNYYYSERSLAVLATVKPELRWLAHDAIGIANKRKLYCPDFGISSGFRTAEEQFELFKKGRAFAYGEWKITDLEAVITNCDGYDVKSAHQSGYALDFFAYVDGKANYEPCNLALIATCFFEAASDLGLNIDWGGSFKSICDAPHIEIII